MSTPEKANGSKSDGLPNFDGDTVFSVLTSRARRRLLVALADGKAYSAAELKHLGKGDGWINDAAQNTNATIKNLKVLIDAEMVMEVVDAGDGRRTKYKLHPGIKPRTENGRTRFDFGCVRPSISPEGD